jgi:small subunit ribosomal protein S10
MLLDSTVKKFVAAANKENCLLKGPIPLPTKIEVYTFCRAPHIEKRSMEQFERLTHKRLLIIDGNNKNAINSIKHVIVPAGVEIHVKN